MVNKPLIRPYFLGGVALGGAARIPFWVAVSTSPKNFKASMRKSVFSAQYYSMPYLLPPHQGNHLSAELQFKEMVVMKHHRDQHEVCT